MHFFFYSVHASESFVCIGELIIYVFLGDSNLQY